MGSQGEYEQAVVVSNDADFAGAMRYVRDDQGLRVTLVNPHSRNTSTRELADAATYVKRLWKSHLRRSQLPDRLASSPNRLAGDISAPSRGRLPHESKGRWAAASRLAVGESLARFALGLEAGWAV